MSDDPYWNDRAERDRRKLAAIAALCDNARAAAGVTAKPITIYVQDVLVILRNQS